jgi:hypothetical protein
MFTRGEALTYLPLSIRPKVNPTPNQIIQRRIRALIHQHCAQTNQRQPHHPCLHAPVYCGAGDIFERPFVAESNDAEDNIDCLEDGNGLDGEVEVLGEKIEEELGPEETF